MGLYGVHKFPKFLDVFPSSNRIFAFHLLHVGMWQHLFTPRTIHINHAPQTNVPVIVLLDAALANTVPLDDGTIVDILVLFESGGGAKPPRLIMTPPILEDGVLRSLVLVVLEVSKLIWNNFRVLPLLEALFGGENLGLYLARW